MTSKSSCADARAQRRDHRRDFRMRQHLVVAGLLDVQNLSLDRKNRLGAPVAALLGGSAGRIALDDEDLRQLRRTFLAVRQLSGQRHAVQRALAADQFAGSPGRLARAGRFDGLADDALGKRRTLFEELAQAVVNQRLDNAFDFAVSQLGLGLTFELRAAEASR